MDDNGAMDEKFTSVGDTRFRLIHKIWEHTLNNYHAIKLRLQESKKENPSFRHSNRTLAVLVNIELSLAQFLSKLGSLSFKPLPLEHIQIETDDCLDHSELTHALNVISSNLNKLDEYLSLLLTNHHELKIKSRRWMYYTFGAVGISVLSVWLLRDSRLSGIINNRLLQTKDSTVWFWSNIIEEPLTIMRHGLLQTYMTRNSNKSVIESELSKANSDLLRRLMLDLAKRTGLEFPPNASDQEMYNMVENRFEEQFRHPIRSLFMGVSAHLMFSIHILKLNLDVEKTMSEAESYVWLATQSNKLAILYLISIIPLGVGYALVKKVNRRTKHKERILKAQGTQLLLNVEKYVNLSSQKKEDPDYVNGLFLYSLDRLYRVVKQYSKTHGFLFCWPMWRNDIRFLGKLDAETSLKLKIISDFKTDLPDLFSLESVDA